MRILTILAFLFTNFAFAQLNTGTGAELNCTEDTFANPAINPDLTYHCQDVIIGNLSTINLNDRSLPLTIRATGSVTINGNILFQGTDGNGDSSGGPGGGIGGIFFISGSPGEPTFPFPEPPQGGETPSQSAECPNGEAEGSGGGGGSLLTYGDNGKAGVYLIGDATVILGGPGGGTLYSFDLNNFFSAGAGGGSGEAGCKTGDAPIDASNGGGGGGGIRIISAGDITITGTINVSGGNGGSLTTIGGAGGGGSGGVIVLQSLSKINLKSTLLALGGKGGTNSTPGDGGNGGNGAPGLIYLEDMDGTRTYSGSFTPLSPSSSKQSLNSDISCGTIAKAEESNSTSLMMMVMGFLLVLGTKILFQFPMKLSRKFVRRN